MGINTTYHDAQIAYFTAGTTHPAPPAGVFLALYIGSMPNDSGTGGTEATGTRPAVTFGSPATDGATGRRYASNTAVTNIQLTNANAGQIVGWGLFGAATGGTPNVVGAMPSAFQVGKNGLINIPAGAIKVYAGAVG